MLNFGRTYPKMVIQGPFFWPVGTWRKMVYYSFEVNALQAKNPFSIAACLLLPAAMTFLLLQLVTMIFWGAMQTYKATKRPLAIIVIRLIYLRKKPRSEVFTSSFYVHHQYQTPGGKNNLKDTPIDTSNNSHHRLFLERLFFVVCKGDEVSVK